MNIPYSYWILIALFIFFCGCKSKQDMNTDKEKKKMLMKFFEKMNDPFSQPAELVTEKELNEEAKSTVCDTLGLIRYMGRKDNFDYYLLNWNVGAFIYKIKVPNRITKKVIPYSKNEEKWLTVGPHSDSSWLPNALEAERLKAKVVANLRSLPKEFYTIKMSGDFETFPEVISKINDSLKTNTPYKIMTLHSKMEDDVLFRNATLFTVIKYLCVSNKLKVTVKGNNIILEKMTDNSSSPKTESKDSKEKK